MLRKLQKDDEELEQIAISKGLLISAPTRRLSLQEKMPHFSRNMLYSFYDHSGVLVAEQVGAAKAFVWLHREATAAVEAIELARTLSVAAPPMEAEPLRL